MSFIHKLHATREELEAYIGSKAKSPFYTKVLDSYMKNPNKPIWCWPAFFPNMFWLCYRKALTPSILLMVVFFTINTMISIMLPLIYSSFITLAVFLIMGFFGINIYLLTAEKEIDIIKENNMMKDDKTILELIAKRGGTSLNYALVFYIAQAILYVTVLGIGSK